MSVSEGSYRNRKDRIGHERGDREAAEPMRQGDRGGATGRQKEMYGGVKVGSAFFGWLAATGATVLLAAIATAIGAVIGIATNTDVAQVSRNPQTIGIVGIIVLLVIVFVAYYCGGYVAGRMARFNGLRQGLVVWLWAVLIAIIVAVIGMAAGSKYDILGQLNSFPRIPVNEGTLGTAGIIAAIVVAAVSLIGALLGGLAGMHFHRKVDRAGRDL